MEVLTTVEERMSLDGPLIGLCRNSYGTQTTDPFKKMKTLCFSLLSVLLHLLCLAYFIFLFYFWLFLMVFLIYVSGQSYLL